MKEDQMDQSIQQEINDLKDTSHSTHRATVPLLDELLYTPYNVLNNGFVRLIDYMGDDTAIVQAARVSYGKGTKSFREDSALINYLMAHEHMSPFEMCEIKFHIKAPIFVVRQWFRHRTANVNEYSARYSKLEDEFYFPDTSNIKQQSQINRQSSIGTYPEDEALRIQSFIANRQLEHYKEYEELLEQGVSRELARVLMSLGTYTQFYWKTDLRNLLHFLKLRLSADAQYEIRMYAKNIYSMLQLWVPATIAAFNNHVLHAITLSESEKHVVRDWLMDMKDANIPPKLLKSIAEKLELEYDK